MSASGPSGPLVSICFRCSKEPSHWDHSFEYPQHMFWLRNKKIIFLLHTLNWRPAFMMTWRDSPLLWTLVLLDRYYMRFFYTLKVTHLTIGLEIYFWLSLHLPPYFMCASSEGYVKKLFSKDLFSFSRTSISIGKWTARKFMALCLCTLVVTFLVTHALPNSLDPDQAWH